MLRKTAATKRAIWWTVSSRMRDGDAGDDDGAAILEGIRPSRLPFSLSILELQRRAIGWRMEEGGCECHVHRGVMRWCSVSKRYERACVFRFISSEMFIFSCSHRPNLRFFLVFLPFVYGTNVRLGGILCCSSRSLMRSS